LRSQSVNTVLQKKCLSKQGGTTLADTGFRCYNACQAMADWKQITARIRRARTSKDPVGQLSNLFEKTRDAMVAFELAKYFETSNQNAEAAKWYFAAAERFRRADWKTKAQEAAVRLGGVPGEIPLETPTQRTDEFQLTPPPVTSPEPDLPFERNSAALESSVAVTSEVQQASELSTSGPSPSEAEGRRRRRGRRGGRNRRRGGAAKEKAEAPAPRVPGTSAPRRGLPPAVFNEPAEPTAPRLTHSRAIPSLPIESVGEPGGPSVKGRYGDPGLSSRISLLEMQFRRLLTCSPSRLDEADLAPVGPGVFVLSDSDLTSYYYVEACQTLRIAIGNLMRGGSSRRGADSIKPQLAEHLGIPEARVPKYLADHCVVRWLQLDEGASHFAHFVIAVLRPSLNE
jgi:hypothetical protein